METPIIADVGWQSHCRYDNWASWHTGGQGAGDITRCCVPPVTSGSDRRRKKGQAFPFAFYELCISFTLPLSYPGRLALPISRSLLFFILCAQPCVSPSLKHHPLSLALLSLSLSFNQRRSYKEVHLLTGRKIWYTGQQMSSLKH